MLQLREAVIIVVIIAILVCGATLLSMSFVRGRVQGQATQCKSNLKNIGMALELYASDANGRFPERLACLAPGYLHSIPSCPAAGEDTYSRGFVGSAEPDAYVVVCSGTNHESVSFGANYPQYTSTQGFVEP